MGTRKSYSEKIKWKTIELKKQGYTNKEIMDQLGIKNKAQIRTWMNWHRKGETYRFSRSVGKQSSLQKASEEGIKEAKLEQVILRICMTNHFRYGH